MKYFQFKEYYFEFTYKKVKYLRLKLKEEGVFKVSVPLFCTQNDVLNFIKNNEEWLKKQGEKLKKMKMSTKDDEIYFLGKKYILKFNENLMKTKITRDSIRSKDEKQLDFFLKQNAKKIFTFYIKKWQKFVKKDINKISIKSMNTRWGSCNHAKAYINLNLRLIEKPLKAIEYVILHELTHLIYPHHRKEFYAFIHNIMPDYKKREKEYF